jgi:ribosomal protein L16 Arg81 hydroxylase
MKKKYDHGSIDRLAGICQTDEAVLIKKGRSQHPKIRKSRNNCSEFETLFSPIGSRQFLSKYYEFNPVKLRKSSKRLSKIDLDIKTLMETVSKGGVEFQHLTLLQEGFRVESSNLKKTSALLRSQEVSLNIYRAERYFPSIRKVAQELSDFFNYPVAASLFYTPPKSRTLDCHFDLESLVLFQLDGEKKWKVYKPLFRNPVASHADISRVMKMVPSRELHCLLSTIVKPGNLLHIPRGFPHEAFSTQKGSLHVTFGFHGASRYDLVENITTHTLQVLADQWPEIRESVDITDESFFKSSEYKNLINTFTEVLKKNLLDNPRKFHLTKLAALGDSLPELKSNREVSHSDRLHRSGTFFYIDHSSHTPILYSDASRLVIGHEYDGIDFSFFNKISFSVQEIIEASSCGALSVILLLQNLIDIGVYTVDS